MGGRLKVLEIKDRVPVNRLKKEKEGVAAGCRHATSGKEKKMSKGEQGVSLSTSREPKDPGAQSGRGWRGRGIPLGSSVKEDWGCSNSAKSIGGGGEGGGGHRPPDCPRDATELAVLLSMGGGNKTGKRHH